MSDIVLNTDAAKAALNKLSQAGLLAAADHERLLHASNMLDDSQQPKVLVTEVLEKLFGSMDAKNREATLRNLAKRFRDAQSPEALLYAKLSPEHAVQLHIQSAKQAAKDQRSLWFSMQRIEVSAPRTHDIEGVPLLVGNPGSPPEWLGLSQPGKEPILIFTVNDNEVASVRELFAPQGSRGFVLNDRFYEFLCNASGRPIIHFHSQMGSTGLGAASIRCAYAIMDHKPSAVLAVGIAFGRKANQSIGDVLISQSIQNYEIQRDNPDHSIDYRASPLDASQAWVERAAHHRNDTYQIHRGLILSGEKLVDNDETRKKLFTQFPKAIGGEMEANGLVAAAHAGKVDWLVIKGVSDWADGQKSTISEEQKQQDQMLAARHAAQVAYYAIHLQAHEASNSPAPKVSVATARGRPKKPEALPRQSTEQAQTHQEIQAKIPDLEALKTLIDNPGKQGSMHNAGEKIDRLSKTRSDNSPALQKQTASSSLPAYAHDNLMDWLKNPEAPPIFALLGEYGMGKTISCQRVYHELKTKRRQNNPPRWQREPLYFDLRTLTLFKDVPRGHSVELPTKEKLINNLIIHGWQSPSSSEGNGKAHSYASVAHSIQQGALLIMDGLDECLVHLTESQHGSFIRSILELLTDNDPDGKAGARLLVSCRTNFFKTFSDQCNLFTGLHRGKMDAQWYTTYFLQPFGAEQIERYLQQVIGDLPLARALSLIADTHNLSELAERPMTLKFIAEHIPRLEALRAAGENINSATLYEQVAQAWLERDEGKHHLRPEHKLRMLPALAAHLWQSRLRSLPYQELHQWFHAWRRNQADLNELYHPSVYDQIKLEEDLRTASFMVREDTSHAADEGFRFAHSSLLEYFLARHLANAVLTNQPILWAMPIPSDESLGFLADILENEQLRLHKLPLSVSLTTTLNQWRKTYLPLASELLLRYALRPTSASAPRPVLAGFDLRGAQLRGWRFESDASAALLPMQGCQWAGADLRQARFDRVRLDNSDWRGARLGGASLVHCHAERGQWAGADLVGTVFQQCRLSDGQWPWMQANASSEDLTHSLYRAQFVQCEGIAHTRAAHAAPLPALALAQPAHLLHSAMGKQKNRLAWLAGHSQTVRSVAFSPDGRFLASGSHDKTLRLWDAASGELLQTLKGHDDSVLSVAFSPDGRFLASGSHDKTLRLWDAASGELLQTLKGHDDSVWSVAFSPDGRFLASGSHDKTLRLWDAASGELLQTLKGHDGSVLSVAFSPDGRFLASGSSDNTLRLWDAASGELLQTLKGHDDSVWSVAFSPDGRFLASGSHDKTLRLWDAASGDLLQTLKGHGGSVLSVAFSPDGRFLASGSHDKTLRLWDAASGDLLQTLKGHGGSVLSVAFSPDGRFLASGSGDDTLRLWDAASGDLLQTLKGHDGSVLSVAFSPDGRFLASGSHDKTLRLWDAASGDLLQTLKGHGGSVWSVAFSPDGRFLASGSHDKTLRLWDAASGDLLQTLKGHGGSVLSVAFSPDGRFLASGSHDKTLRLWDAASGDLLQTLKGHGGSVLSVAFSPDGRFLASGSGDDTLRLWDAASGDLLQTLKGHDGSVLSVAFSPDGRFLASGSHDKTLRLWDAASGDLLQTLKGHGGSVLSVAFSPDGRFLASGSHDKTLRLWDAASGDLLQTLKGHGGSVWSVAFSPDGRFLASGSGDDTLRLWDAASGEQTLGFWANSSRELRGAAAWQPQRLLHASGDAWRMLAWQVWDHESMPHTWTRLPIPANYTAPELNTRI